MGVAGRMLTVREVATRLQVHEESVRRWLREGQIRGVPLGGRAGWRIPEEELGRFLEERRRRPRNAGRTRTPGWNSIVAVRASAGFLTTIRIPGA
jgi:excisionase family DNA binding protein